MASLVIQNFLELALQLERNGVKFYNYWSEKSGSDKLEMLFKMLADEEEEHIRDFLKIASGYKESGNRVEISKEFQEFYNMFSEKVLFSHDEFKSISDIGEAIETAKKQEIDSQLFYFELKKHVDKEYYDIVDRIISEEEKHYKKLNEIQKTLKI